METTHNGQTLKKKYTRVMATTYGSILNIRNSKCNCLQLTITPWLHPAMDHATREIKYVNNLIEQRKQHEMIKIRIYNEKTENVQD